MAIVMAESSALALQQKVIEDLVARDPEVRSHQSQLCFTCEKVIQQSGIIASDLKLLLE